jgi:hypothetical protein
MEQNHLNNLSLIRFYVTPTQFRSYGDVPALLVEEDHKGAPE